MRGDKKAVWSLNSIRITCYWLLGLTVDLTMCLIQFTNSPPSHNNQNQQRIEFNSFSPQIENPTTHSSFHSSVLAPSHNKGNIQRGIHTTLWMRDAAEEITFDQEAGDEFEFWNLHRGQLPLLKWKWKWEDGALRDYSGVM